MRTIRELIAKRALSALAATLLVMAGACSSGTEDTENGGSRSGDILFRQSFTPSEQYIPEALAIEQGIFESLDLDVSIQAGTGGGLSAALVAGGSNPLGMAGASDVLTSRDQGVDVVAIATSIPADPSALISLSSNPIRDLRALRGKRIGIIPGSTSFSLLNAALQANDMDVTRDVTTVVLGFGDLISSLIEGRVDAIAAFETTNVPALEDAGATPVVLRFSELGVGVAGNVYIANPEFARANPETVARFLQGVARGYQHLQEVGIDEGIDALTAQFPELARQRDLLKTRYQYALENGYLPFGPGEEMSLENMEFDQPSLESLNDALLATGLISSPVEIESAFDSRYIELARDLEAES